METARKKSMEFASAQWRTWSWRIWCVNASKALESSRDLAWLASWTTAQNAPPSTAPNIVRCARATLCWKMVTAGNVICLAAKNALLRVSVRTVLMTTGLILSMENVCVGGLQKNLIRMEFALIVMWKGVPLVLLTILINATSAMIPKHQLSMESVCALMAKS